MDQSDSWALESYQSYIGNSSAESHRIYIEFFATVTQLLGATNSTAAAYAEDMWQLEKAIAEVLN